MTCTCMAIVYHSFTQWSRSKLKAITCSWPDSWVNWLRSLFKDFDYTVCVHHDILLVKDISHDREKCLTLLTRLCLMRSLAKLKEGLAVSCSVLSSAWERNKRSQKVKVLLTNIISRHRVGQTNKYMWTGQTDRQTDRPTDRQTERQTDK